MKGRKTDRRLPCPKTVLLVNAPKHSNHYLAATRLCLSATRPGTQFTVGETNVHFSTAWVAVSGFDVDCELWGGGGADGTAGNFGDVGAEMPKNRAQKLDARIAHGIAKQALFQ
ncbi:hypothetical protein HK100_005079 [Physocladia obscura]|uniref:Uncharacterized protein n=1 Tax=Physocladia obscura TaxID=109957 RepID=A0AAD5T8K2_9FUNG|nr:hypothetical protein HK100_005079 [Physocladia obscura]